MHRERVWYLKNVLSLFMGLPDADHQAFDKLLTHFHCKANTPVYVPDDRHDQVYLLKEGRVRLAQLSPEGKEITLDYLEPGAVFGALGEEAGGAPLMAEAVENAFICRIPRRDFELFISGRPQLMFGVTKLLGLRLQRIQMRLQTLLFHDVKSRILLTLEELARTYGEPFAGGTRLRLKLTHQDIANLIGATRETTSQAISELRADGKLEFDKKHPILKAQSAARAV